MQEHITVRTRTSHEPTQNRTEFRQNETPISLGQNSLSVGTPVARAAGRGGAGAGLVPSKTSGTPEHNALYAKHSATMRNEQRKMAGVRSDAILVDREASRLKRLKCSVLTAARLHVQQKQKWKVAMLTLTYAPAFDWEPNQITDIVRHIRQWLKRLGVEWRYVWVQEFTKRGRPHYHMLVWLPLGITLPKPDKRGWWPYGMTKIEWARNAIGYIAKYASKADSLHLPAKGARMHGNGGVTGEALLEQRWWKLPAWMREKVEPANKAKRRKGGGFIDEEGEFYASPWEVFFQGGQVYIQRKEAIA